MLELSYKTYPSSLSITLPINKSIVARQMLLDYIYKAPLSVRLRQMKGALLPDDIVHLNEALLRMEERRNIKSSSTIELAVGQSGTAYRFLLVLALFEDWDTVLLHDPQLTSRICFHDLLPFIELGADIAFHPTFNRTIIRGGRVIRGVLDDAQWNTSQFSSAILLTEPIHQGRLLLKIGSDRPSYSYYNLTKTVIEHYHAHQSNYHEGDGSSAAFWYQLMLMHPEVEEIKLIGFDPQGAHPDSQRLPELFKSFGIHTKGNQLTRNPFATVKSPLSVRLAQNLDLYPSFILSALWTGTPFSVSGVSNLRYKESDRIASVMNNLLALGVDDIIVNEDYVVSKVPTIVPRVTFSPRGFLNSYDDHRIAMAFSILCTSIKGGKYVLKGDEVVSKSYPNFYDELLHL